MSHKPSGRRYRRYIATAYARLLTQCEAELPSGHRCPRKAWPAGARFCRRCQAEKGITAISPIERTS